MSQSNFWSGARYGYLNSKTSLTLPTTKSSNWFLVDHFSEFPKSCFANFVDQMLRVRGQLCFSQVAAGNCEPAVDFLAATCTVGQLLFSHQTSGNQLFL